MPATPPPSAGGPLPPLFVKCGSCQHPGHCFSEGVCVRHGARSTTAPDGPATTAPEPDDRVKAVKVTVEWPQGDLVTGCLVAIGAVTLATFAVIGTANAIAWLVDVVGRALFWMGGS